MAIDTNSLVYLIDPFWQGEGINGKPLVGGYMTVFYAGTDLKYITYQNFDGTENPFKIPLGADGRATILVEAQYTYDCYLYDSFGNLAASRLNVKPNIGGGNISIKGRTYHGIEPVVVNNQYNLISARNIPLGVQEPLFFVEDSEEGCIIGASGLQPSGNYATVDQLNDYQPISAMSSYMTENNVEFDANGNITAYNGSAFAGGYVDPSDFIPWSASGNFATSGDLNDKLDITAFSNVSGDFLTAVPDDYATKDFVSSGLSSKLDSTAFSTVSGNFLTAHQSLDGYATEDWVENKGYITGIDGALYESGFEYDGDKISAYNGSAFVGEGGSVTGEYELSAGNGIAINNDPINQKTVISVSADYATTAFVSGVSADITAMIPTALTGEYLDKASADTLYYPLESNPSGYLTAHQDLSDYQTTAGMTAYQPVGSYLTADALDNVSGDWNEVSAKLDTTAFSDVSGSFLTAHQDISNKLDTTAFSDVSGSFLTAVPEGYATEQWVGEQGYLTAHQSLAGYLQDSDLGIVNDKITAISGVELSAGTELEFEYDAADNISAINNSAISTTPAQPLYAKSPLYFDVTGTSSYMGINSADLARMMGVDETVLFTNQTETSASMLLSEPLTNFNYFEIYGHWNYNGNATMRLYNKISTDPDRGYANCFSLGGVAVSNIITSINNLFFCCSDYSANGTTVIVRRCFRIDLDKTLISNSDGLLVDRIVGIGRKEV